MLNEQEKIFYDYWKTKRLQKMKWTSMIFDGLPRGLIFAVPIILFFMIEGARDKSLIHKTDLILICLGTFSVAVFYSVFGAYLRRERNEEKFQSLQNKINIENASTISAE